MTKWDVQNAVVRSKLPPLARLVMLMLIDAADADTAEISERHSLSITDLARRTGMARSSVTKELNRLDGLGWVKRDRPSVEDARTKFAKTGYRLCIGSDPEPRSPRDLDRHTDQVPRPPHGLGLDRDTDQARPPDGPDLGRHTDSKNPPPTKPTKPPKGRKRAPAAETTNGETTEQRVNRLAAVYTDRVPLSNFVAVRGVVKKAVTAKVTDELITKGLNALADDGRSVTTDSLRYAIYGVPPSQFGKAAYTGPYQDKSNTDYHGDL